MLLIQNQRSIFTDLKQILEELEKRNKIGTFDAIDNFAFPWIKMVNTFDVSESVQDFDIAEVAERIRKYHSNDVLFHYKSQLNPMVKKPLLTIDLFISMILATAKD